MDHKGQEGSQQDHGAQHIKLLHIFCDDCPEDLASQLKFQRKSQDLGKLQFDIPALCGESGAQILKKSFDAPEYDHKDAKELQHVDAQHHSAG